ncbi:hypothetical protein AURDEDRAFT_125935 [Auricularia subglabra TFB-10046 SS5]|nr:hypothetical protein AURDEDRAFT_125935 [Auricularia subglabra TFB-10046 SS5]
MPQSPPDRYYEGDRAPVMQRIALDLTRLAIFLRNHTQPGVGFEVDASSRQMLVVNCFELPYPAAEHVFRDSWQAPMPTDPVLDDDDLDDEPWPFRLVIPTICSFGRLEQLRIPLDWLQRLSVHLKNLNGWPEIRQLVLCYSLGIFKYLFDNHIGLRGIHSIVIELPITGPHFTADMARGLPAWLPKFAHSCLERTTGPRIVGQVQLRNLQLGLGEMLPFPFLVMGDTRRENMPNGHVQLTFMDVFIPHVPRR